MARQKRRETRIETLIRAFETDQTLSKFVIQTMFPTASPAQMVWQLQNRRGMTIEKYKDGRNVMYRYHPEIPAPIIKGSKKQYKLDTMLNREVF